MRAKLPSPPMTFKTMPELPQLTVEQKLQRILELGDEALTEEETQAELTQVLNATSDAEDLPVPSRSSKEFIAAVEKSIGAPVLTKRFKIRK